MKLSYLLLWGLLATFIGGAVQAEDLYRILYSNDPIRDHAFHSKVLQKQMKQSSRQRKRVKRPSTDKKPGEITDPYILDAYGSKVYVVPESGDAPKEPVLVDGIMIPTDVSSDPDWVRSRKEALNLGLKFKPISDPLGEKWAEYNFIKTHAPKMAPPPTHLGSDFVSSVLTEAELKNRKPEAFEKLSEAQQKALAAKIEQKLKEVKPEFFTAAAEKIRGVLKGEGFIKLRFGFHSEGNVPKTYKDLAATWKGYIEDTRPKIKAKLQKEGTYPMGVSNAQLEIQNEIWDWDHIEGTVLEEWVLDPSMIVVQKKIKLTKEVRLHVVEHEVLKGATFLRMYEPLGQFLTASEMDTWEKQIRDNFLANLTGKYRPFSCSPDVVLDGDTGTYRILDLNPGYESGYLFPDEDIITTHVFSKHYTGKSTPLLDRMTELREAAFANKGELLKSIRTDYADFVYGDKKDGYDHPSFWDRVIRIYVDEALKESPTPQRFNAILEDFDEAGLKSVTIFYQLINEVQSLGLAHLSDARLKEWATRLNEISEKFDPGYAATLEDGKLVVKETEG